MTRLFPSTIVICTFLFESACIQREKLHTVRNGSTQRTKPFMRNFVRNGRKTIKGNCKTIFINLQEHPLLISGSMHEASYRFRGAAKGGKLKGKEPNPPQCTRSKLRLLQRACLNQTCMPARFYLFDKHATSIVVATHKRDPWCFRVYRCSQHSQKLDHLLWYHTGKLMEVVRVFRKEDTVAVLRICLDQD